MSLEALQRSWNNLRQERANRNVKFQSWDELLARMPNLFYNIRSHLGGRDYFHPTFAEYVLPEDAGVVCFALRKNGSVQVSATFPSRTFGEPTVFDLGNHDPSDLTDGSILERIARAVELLTDRESEP